MLEESSLPFIDRFSQAIITGGREIERSLQIAAGAICLTILTVLPSMWTDISAPQGRLRLAYLTMFAYAGTAFVIGLLATAVRINFFAPLWPAWPAWLFRVVNATVVKWMHSVLWSLCIALSVSYLVGSGYKLINDALTATSREIDAIERQCAGETGRVGKTCVEDQSGSRISP